MPNAQQDYRELVTMKQFNEVKHACYTERDFLTATLRQRAFYAHELKFMIDSKAQTMGIIAGKVIDREYFKAKIAECDKLAKDYQSAYATLAKQLKEITPFIHAMQWNRSLP